VAASDLCDESLLTRRWTLRLCITRLRAREARLGDFSTSESLNAVWAEGGGERWRESDNGRGNRPSDGGVGGVEGLVAARRAKGLIGRRIGVRLVGWRGDFAEVRSTTDELAEGISARVWVRERHTLQSVSAEAGVGGTEDSSEERVLVLSTLTFLGRCRLEGKETRRP
jgi:hypothetical protein